MRKLFKLFLILFFTNVGYAQISSNVTEFAQQDQNYFSNQTEMIAWAKANEIVNIDYKKLADSFILVFREAGGLIDGIPVGLELTGNKDSILSSTCKGIFLRHIKDVTEAEVAYANSIKSDQPPEFSVKPDSYKLDTIARRRDQMKSEMLFASRPVKNDYGIGGEKDLECPKAANLVSGIFDTFQSAKISQSRDQIAILQEKFRANPAAGAVATDHSTPQVIAANEPIMAPAEKQVTPNSVAIEISKGIEHKENSNYPSSLLTWILIGVSIFVVFGALISTPITLYLKFSGGVTILENLTDAIFSLCSLVGGLLIFAALSKTVNNSVENAALSAAALLYLGWHIFWMHKVAKRSNSSNTRVWLVTFARIVLSLLPLVYLFMGEKQIQGQRENETNEEYNNRYQKEAQENLTRKKNKSIFGWLTLGLTTLSVEKFSFEGLSSYFSRSTAFVKT
jgi:hypothetical protein